MLSEDVPSNEPQKRWPVWAKILLFIFVWPPLYIAVFAAEQNGSSMPGVFWVIGSFFLLASTFLDEDMLGFDEKRIIYLHRLQKKVFFGTILLVVITASVVWDRNARSGDRDSSAMGGLPSEFTVVMRTSGAHEWYDEGQDIRTLVWPFGIDRVSRYTYRQEDQMYRCCAQEGDFFYHFEVIPNMRATLETVGVFHQVAEHRGFGDNNERLNDLAERWACTVGTRVLLAHPDFPEVPWQIMHTYSPEELAAVSGLEPTGRPMLVQMRLITGENDRVF